MNTIPGCVDHDLNDVFSFLNLIAWILLVPRLFSCSVLASYSIFLLMQVSSVTCHSLSSYLQTLTDSLTHAQGVSSRWPSVDSRPLLSSTDVLCCEHTWWSPRHHLFSRSKASPDLTPLLYFLPLSNDGHHFRMLTFCLGWSISIVNLCLS